eukprot:273508-Hanusia_phi.AAC.3
MKKNNTRHRYGERLRVEPRERAMAIRTLDLSMSPRSWHCHCGLKDFMKALISASAACVSGTLQPQTRQRSIVINLSKSCLASKAPQAAILAVALPGSRGRDGC